MEVEEARSVSKQEEIEAAEAPMDLVIPTIGSSPSPLSPRSQRALRVAEQRAQVATP